MIDNGKRYFFVLMIGLLWPFIGLASQREMVDQVGRTVSVPKNPTRIISFAPSITEMIYALDQQKYLVGATKFSDYPEAANQLPKIGSYVRLDLEKIISLNPDLCIAIKDGNPKVTVDRLSEMGIPVFAVSPYNTETVMEAVELLGDLLNARKKVNSLITDMRHRIKQVQDKVAKIDRHPRVFFQIGITPIVSVSSNTFVDEIITLAGGQNVVTGSVPYPRYSTEQVLNLKPEVFIISSMAGKDVFQKIKAEWEQWPQMPAVRDNRIYLVDSNLFYRPTPRLVDALEILVQILHPELF